jgi:sarcosine oxidase subunit beta
MRDVAIIGAGVVGWSSAYFLLKSNPKLSVSVIDRYPSFAMGSTGRAAGGVRAQFGTEVNISLSIRSIEFFEEFEQRTGVDPNFRQYGYLFTSATASGAKYLESTQRLQKDLGVPSKLLSARQVQEKCPYLLTADVVAATFSPTDGYLDPYSVCKGFENAARAMGGTAMYGRELSAPPESEVTVLCTGHWSKDVGAMLGIDLPVAAEKHQLAMTDSARELPQRLPMVVDLDTSFHFRREGEGLLVGFNADLPHEQVEEEPGFDFAFLEQLADVGLHRLPLLGSLGFDTKKCWAGYYAETPDRHAIIGEMNGVVVATGFGGHGVMHSPAAGMAVSEIVLEGSCTSFDINGLRPSRFAENDLIVEPMVI